MRISLHLVSVGGLLVLVLVTSYHYFFFHDLVIKMYSFDMNVYLL